MSNNLANGIHEAPCYNLATSDLFFAEWGLPGRDWQYLLNTRSNTLHKIQTDPPIHKAHVCVIWKGQLYVVTDGYENVETGRLVRIDPNTWKREVILNNYRGQPFLGLKDVDAEGNFWLTDSKSACVSLSTWAYLKRFAIFSGDFLITVRASVFTDLERIVD
jgi:gluconolactonase